MAKENVKILKVNTEAAQKSIKDLKKEIEAASIALAKMEEGTAQYDKAADELAKQQEVLNKAIGLSKNAAKDAEGSYNAIAKKMAELRKEWKATGDAAERAKLGEQILDLNNQLKEMDASTGNFQRNVGNYSGSIIDALGKFGQASSNATGAMIGGFEMATQAVKLFQASNPIGAITLALSFLVQNLDAITELLSGPASKALNEFKLEAEATAKQIEQIGKDVDFDIAVAEAAGASREELYQMRLEAAKTALALADMNKQQADALKANVFNRKKVTEAQEEASKQAQEAWDNYIKVLNDGVIADTKARHEQTKAIADNAEERKRIARELFVIEGKEVRENTITEIKAMYADEDALREEEEAAELASMRKRAAENEKLEKERTAAKERETKRRVAIETAGFSATKTLLGAVADAMEANGDASEEQVKDIKSLRIASAIIDTLQASIAAYRSGLEIGGPAGMAVGAAQMVAALATGYATVKKIQATSVSKEGGAASATSTASQPSVAVAPPVMLESTPVVRTLTGASEEERLNRMANNTRVSVVYSDIEAAGNRVDVDHDEARF